MLPTTSEATSDRWLERWLDLIAAHSAGLPILELGCGGGRDSEVLVAGGHRLVGIDLSSAAIAQARRRVPAGEFHCQDIQAPWPVERAGVIVASLSLHYFPWVDTVVLVERIRRTLEPGGLLLCRLNSTNDHHYGASGHPAIAENFYLVDGELKRFFDRAAIDRLFAQGWRSLHKKEGVIARYDHPKSVWEVILERS
jgi:SAM-dependent methyltransferase